MDVQMFEKSTEKRLSLSSSFFKVQIQKCSVLQVLHLETWPFIVSKDDTGI